MRDHKNVAGKGKAPGDLAGGYPSNPKNSPGHDSPSNASRSNDLRSNDLRSNDLRSIDLRKNDLPQNVPHHDALQTAARTAARGAAPPGPKSSNPFLGVLPRFKKNPPAFLLSVAREFGDIALMRFGNQRVYLISNPEWIRGVLVTNQSNFVKSRILQKSKVLLGEGLLTSEGEFHKRQRRLVQPAFHRDRLERYGADMVSCAVRTREQWAAFADSHASFDMAREMARLTLAIVGRTLFSADMSSDADEVRGAMGEILSLFDSLLMPFSDLIRKLPLPSVRRFERARDRLDQLIYRLIAERRASGEDTGDLLSMLLMASEAPDRDAQSDASSKDAPGGASGKDAESGASNQAVESLARMSDKQVRDEALTLFIAGHETTANALTWTWYLLSQNPEVEARMHAEIQEVLGGRLPEFADVMRLPYTCGVFAEALRLYPPAWTIGRKALADYEIDGYKIPAGSIVLTSPWVVHRDPRWWPEPERFDPARWITEQSDARPKFAYFPFGGGTRVCIGERFAMAEGAIVLATISQRWCARLMQGHPVETQAVITLRARHGMQMTIQPTGQPAGKPVGEPGHETHG